MGKLIAQFFRFSCVGVTATLIDYGLMVALTELAGINYLVSATISFTVSVIFNYLASMRFVYTHRPELSRRREFITFFALALVGLGLNTLLMWLAVEHLLIDYRIAKLPVCLIVALWNFGSRKYFLDASK